jgi:hypothetical protein
MEIMQCNLEDGQTKKKFSQNGQKKKALKKFQGYNKINSKDIHMNFSSLPVRRFFNFSSFPICFASSSIFFSYQIPTKNNVDRSRKGRERKKSFKNFLNH